jgi:hypothetical protein
MKTQYLERPELIKSGDRAGEVINVKVKEPYTIESFCLFIEMTVQWFFKTMNEESDNKDNDLVEALIYVSTQIKRHQISGGINGVFNPMVVSRLNNLSDTVNQVNTGKSTDIKINVNGKDIDITAE